MMSTRRAFLLSTAGIAGAATVGCKPDLPPEHPKPPLMGEATAPKRFVLWGSYTCPFTAQLLGILDGIVASMPKTVSLEWHHFPTHAPDPALHVAGLAFKDAHFWGFTRRVLGEVLKTGGDYAGLTPERVAEFAKAEGGNDEARFLLSCGEWATGHEQLRWSPHSLAIAGWAAYLVSPEAGPAPTKALVLLRFDWPSLLRPSAPQPQARPPCSPSPISPTSI